MFKKIAKMIVAIVFILSVTNCYSKEVKIVSFNIKSFGKSKMSKKPVVDILEKILNTYDIICIQEVRDKSMKSVQALVWILNGERDIYKYIASDRLGRSNRYKEQYLVIYNKYKFQLVSMITFYDYNDLFEREPMSVRFKHLKSTDDPTHFTIMNIHINPDLAGKEINSLNMALQSLCYYEDKIIILGDLNADCSYYDVKKKPPFLNIPKFNWLIKDDMDTTASPNTNCAYDRIIVSKYLYPQVVSSGIIDFQKEYNLTYDQAKAVSDHFPVFVNLNLP